MLDLPDQFSLTDRRADMRVKADCTELTGRLAQKSIANRWWSDPALNEQAIADEPDYTWDWPRWVEESRGYVYWRRVALIASDDPDVQGAMLYRLNACSQLSPDRLAAEVVLVATAPWNRPWLTDSPRYQGVGSALLLRVACHSQQLGLDGIVLDAVRSARTLDFYERHGFRRISDTGFGTIKMQASSNVIDRWLREEGLFR